MIWYLVLAVLLTNGEPATTFSYPFSTKEACEAAGNEASVKLVKDDTIRQAAWQCLAVNFDKADPVPPKHIPGENEA